MIPEIATSRSLCHSRSRFVWPCSRFMDTLRGSKAFLRQLKAVGVAAGFALAVSFGVLMYGFLAHDFTIKYVADNNR